MHQQRVSTHICASLALQLLLFEYGNMLAHQICLCAKEIYFVLHGLAIPNTGEGCVLYIDSGTMLWQVSQSHIHITVVQGMPFPKSRIRSMAIQPSVINEMPEWKSWVNYLKLVLTDRKFMECRGNTDTMQLQISQVILFTEQYRKN
jgi:hypothetical protein